MKCINTPYENSIGEVFYQINFSPAKQVKVYKNYISLSYSEASNKFLYFSFYDSIKRGSYQISIIDDYARDLLSEGKVT